MFDSRMAIDNHGHVVHEGRTPFRYNHHLEFTSRRDNLLSLVASWLVITFDTEGPNSFHSLQMESRIFQRIDLRLEATGCSIEDGTCRECPRSDDNPRLSHFRSSEGAEGVIRRIMNRRDTKGQPRIVHPIRLWHEAA